MKCVDKIYKNCNGQSLLEIVTGYETGIHYIKSKRKIDNKVCLTKKAKRPVIAKRFQSTKKVKDAIFLKREGPVVQIAISKGRSITGYVYKNYLLKKVKKHYKKEETNVWNSQPSTSLGQAHNSQIV